MRLMGKKEELREQIRVLQEQLAAEEDKSKLAEAVAPALETGAKVLLNIAKPHVERFLEQTIGQAIRRPTTTIAPAQTELDEAFDEFSKTLNDVDCPMCAVCVFMFEHAENANAFETTGARIL
jgi:hypothetical protein